jgi:DNA transformation protein and related proteins
MAKAPHPLIEYICDQLAAWSPVVARRLFGGWGLYRDGIMFGLIGRETVYFRTDDRNRGDFEAEGMEPFRYRMPNGKTIDLAYHRLPADALEDGEELGRWADTAFAAAQSAANAKKPRTKAKAAASDRPGRPAKAGRPRARSRRN